MLTLIFPVVTAGLAIAGATVWVAAVAASPAGSAFAAVRPASVESVLASTPSDQLQRPPWWTGVRQ